MKRESEIENNIHQEVLERMIAYITAAFGLVAGLAWNDAIQAFIQYVFPIGKDSLWAKLTYAILLTLIVTLVTIYFARLFPKKE